MPEGPECRYRASQLRFLIGQKLKYFQVLSSSRYKECVVDVNQKLIDIRVEGKYTFFLLEKYVIRIHYGMEGNLVSEKTKHSHIILHFEKPIYFHDTRKFGTFSVMKYSEYIDSLKHNDMFEIDFDTFVINLRKKNSEVCGVLLDQNYISGIGNYLRAEILYEANVYPGKYTRDLTHTELVSIFNAMKSIGKESLSKGGCTIKSYKSIDGLSGRYVCKAYGVLNKYKFKDGRTMYWK